MRSLSLDVVIATRNRPDALALSIPLILGQSRPPDRLVIVDSSDDHAAVQAAVAGATRGWTGPVRLLRSEAGLTRQRNLGLREVTADIVLFPDDDSMLYPGTIAEILAVYGRDTGGRIAGVCTATAPLPPEGFGIPGFDMGSDPDTPPTANRYSVPAEMRRQMRSVPLKNRLRRRFNALDPIFYVGQSLMAQATPLPWFADANCRLVEVMGGYRMSFRTEIARRIGFNETLGAYAHCEDYDASFAAARHGLIVGARNARIHHHKYPSGRGSAFRQGAMRMLNTAYVVLRHCGPSPTPPTRDRAATLLRRFAILYPALSLPSLHHGRGRDFLAGFRAAAHGLEDLLAADPDTLDAAYAEAMRRALIRNT